MGKRLPNTPKSKVRAALRQLWLRSRERAAALKREHYCCEVCGVKQSKAKGKEQAVEVHHKNGIDWHGITELVCKRIFQTPDDLQVLCPECHDKLHAKTDTDERK